MTEITIPYAEMHRAEDIVKAAWNSPTLRAWNPNTHPTCRATVRAKTNAAGLILPAHMRENSPVYFVDFKCEFGQINGAPAYRITGTVNGNSIVIKEGYMVEK